MSLKITNILTIPLSKLSFLCLLNYSSFICSTSVSDPNISLDEIKQAEGATEDSPKKKGLRRIKIPKSYEAGGKINS